MTKLQQSASTLNEHLLGKDRGKMYLSLRQAFLDSLKRDVEAQSNLFKQEQLQEEDAEVLKDVLTQVEAAKFHLSLHSHIPFEKLNELYESLIGRTIVYFNKINKEITIKFRSLREESLQGLEKIMKEMNLIRKIPVVEVRTSEAYNSTLDILCECISDLKREIENILSIIFQRREEGNYNRLSSCLTSLQHAQWIDNFRHGVHWSIMDNIKNQVLRQISSIQIFVKHVRLDENNPENLEMATKMVKQINQIKHFKDIFEGLGSMIEQTNSLFEEKLSKALAPIKEFCDEWGLSISKKVKERVAVEEEEKKNNKSQKLKEIPLDIQGSQLEYQSLDLLRIDKYLRYLLICNHSNQLQKENANLFIDMEDIIKAQGELYQKDMQDCFSFIKSFDGRSQNELFKAAQKLSTCLEQVKEIAFKYPQISQRFDPDHKMVSDWKIKLINYLTQLSLAMDQMRVSKDSQEYNKIFMITKSLSCLDNFLINHENLEHQNKIYNEAPKSPLKIAYTIKNSDYEMVLNEMAQLEGFNNPVLMRQSQEAKKILNDHIDNMLEETYSMARLFLVRNNIIKEKVEAIVKNLRKIQNAKSLLASRIDHPNKLDECINIVKVTISDGLKEFIKYIERLIQNNNFKEFDSQKTSLNLICDILGVYCENEVLVFYKKLDITQKAQLDALKAKYVKMELNEYIWSPAKNTLDNLISITNPNPIYVEALEMITEIINKTFRTEFKKVQENKGIYASHLSIQILDLAVTCLPNSIKAPLELELKYITEIIPKSDPNEVEKVHKSVESANPFKSIVEFLVKTTRTFVFKNMQELKAKITTYLS